jgi:hypothetical protein
MIVTQNARLTSRHGHHFAGQYSEIAELPRFDSQLDVPRNLPTYTDFSSGLFTSGNCNVTATDRALRAFADYLAASGCREKIGRCPYPEVLHLPLILAMLFMMRP